jgi:cell division protein FtsN
VKPSKPSLYGVQLGAFRSARNAEALAEKLRGQFEGILVEQFPGGETPYRVRIGSPSLAAAKQVRERLAKQGIASFLILPGSR